MAWKHYRHIHLDFHTSEAITEIGAQFDADEFGDTLDRARVNSIALFARGHHGWLYYHSPRFAHMQHPHLKRDLLREQIEACHKRGINAPIYVTVQWDNFIAEHHPEWRVVDPNGRLNGTPPYEPGFYKILCLNSPYVDYLKETVDDVMQTLPTDGLFFDIVFTPNCSCHYCKTDMLKKGMDPSDDAQRLAFGVEVIQRFKNDMSSFVRERSSDCTIFYNSGHVGPQHRSVKDAYTHWELESLPTGGWGYLHFPMTARYARTLGMDFFGMTGKFHTSWGDFHSFKNEAALQFECFRMLALNGKCSIGDQLPPRGKICPHTYDLIGSVYKQVEAKEPWCTDAEPVVELAVLTPEEFSTEYNKREFDEIMGAAQLLEEPETVGDGLQTVCQYDVVDSKADFSKYKVLVLPDAVPVDEALADKIEAFVAGGGKLLASYRSGLRADGQDFALPSLGIELVGEGEYAPDFLVPEGELGEGLRPTEHVLYSRGLHVRPKDAEVAMSANAPYFNRTFEHFCSHRHAPSSGKTANPAATRKGDVIYFAHPIFSTYQQAAPLWIKKIFFNALNTLNPEPVLQVKAPTTLRAAVNAQQGRWVLHLLHYVPERKCKSFDVIEDIIPLRDVEISLRPEQAVKSVKRVPEGESLEFAEENGRVRVSLPLLEGHQMIEVSFE